MKFAWQVFCLVLLGCANPDKSASPTQEIRGEALGTTWMVKYTGQEDPNEVGQGVTEVLAEVDAAMSTWRDDSELSLIRSTAGPVVVSEDTYQVVRAALDLAEATGGAFDPTVEPLIELWGFHGKRLNKLPSDESIAAALEQVGWSKVTLARNEDHQPLVDGGGTALDLSAIAKGHAVDRVSNMLSRLGLASHLVEVGGEVRAHGQSPSGRPWRLGVDRPEPGLAPGAQLEAAINLTNASLATSGNYRNRYEVEGTVISHTLDPRTGQTVNSTLASATVVAPDCRTADGLATALIVLGEPGMKLVNNLADVEALLLIPDGGEFKQVKSDQMDDYLVE